MIVIDNCAVHYLTRTKQIRLLVIAVDDDDDEDGLIQLALHLSALDWILLAFFVFSYQFDAIDFVALKKMKKKINALILIEKVKVQEKINADSILNDDVRMLYS